VKVSPQLAQNLGVRTAIAERGKLATTVEATGGIAFDERAVHLVQARTAGYVEALFVRAPLDPVRKGQPLARLFVPEWAGAQQEYLALKASKMEGAEELARAARNRLLLLNMSEEQVQAVDRDGKPVTRVTLVSPADGIVGELGAREGMNVMPGTTLFRVNGLGTVWVNVDVPEAAAAAVRPGAPISALVPAYPGERFAGRVSAVLPEVTAATRTVRARVELPNPGAKLKPGMYATVSITPRETREAVLVPSESVIMTGTRNCRSGRSRGGAFRVCGGRGRPRGRRTHRDPQGDRGRSQGRRIGTVPHRFRVELAWGGAQDERSNGQQARPGAGRSPGPSRRRQARAHRPP
jgi:Cu(I)/Ag(I) efflux system membrane fusion protein